MSRYIATESHLHQHATGIVRLWAEGLSDMTEALAQDKLARGYVANPAGDGRCVLLFVDDRPEPVGVQCLYPRRFHLDEQTLDGAALADYVVNEHHRSLGPALQLFKRSVAVGVAAYAFVYGTPNVKSLAVCKRAGIAQIGALRRYGKLLSIRFAFRHRAAPAWLPWLAPVADTLLRGLDAGLRLIRGTRMRCRDAAWADPALDQLWCARSRHLLLCERSAHTLRWQYESRVASQGWRLTLAWAGQTPMGYVVWRLQQGIAVVDDFFSLAPEQHTLGLMLAFAGHARQHQACAISLEFFGHPKVPAALRRAGFLSKNDIAPVVLQCRADTPTLAPERLYFTGFERDQ